MFNLKKIYFIPLTAVLLSFSMGSLMAAQSQYKGIRSAPPVMPGPIIAPNKAPGPAQKKVEQVTPADEVKKQPVSF